MDEVFGCDVTFLLLIQLLEGLAEIKEGVLEHAGPHMLNQLLHFEVQLPCLSIQLSCLLPKDLIKGKIELSILWLPLTQLSDKRFTNWRKSITEFTVFDLVLFSFIKSLHKQYNIIVIKF